MADVLKCWCGNSNLLPFSDHYLKCGQCLTLVSAGKKEEDYYKGDDFGDSLYGKDYWLNHVVQLGTPDIVERARFDLVERDIYWLRDILQYNLPPGKSIELGCCHGGSVYLMQLAGFDAIGTEMSPWLCDLADKMFNVKMLCGAFETLDLAPESFNVVSMYDVLEHLIDPFAAIEKVARILREDGVLAIQTPWCRELDKSFEDLDHEGADFLVHLKEDEHLYLFTKESIVKMLRKAGFNSFAFEPQIFGYDMWLFASKSPFKKNNSSDVEAYLSRTPHGRLVLGFMDLYKKNEINELKIDKLESTLGELKADFTDILEREQIGASLVYEKSLTWRLSMPFRKLVEKLLKLKSIV